MVRVTFQEVVDGACELLCAYVCACECVKIFTVQKFRQWHTLAKLAKFSPDKNFHVYGSLIVDMIKIS